MLIQRWYIDEKLFLQYRIYTVYLFSNNITHMMHLHIEQGIANEIITSIGSFN